MNPIKMSSRNWWAYNVETSVGLWWMNRSPNNTAIPNVYYSLLSWEADLVVLTKSNHLYEVEIKVDHQDLKSDMKKQKWDDKTGGTIQRRMRQFWYAVPVFLVEKTLSIVPEWCGVMSVDERGKVLVVRTAKISKHAKALSNDEVHRLLRCGVFRFWSQRENIMCSDSFYFRD